MSSEKTQNEEGAEGGFPEEASGRSNISPATLEDGKGLDRYIERKGDWGKVFSHRVSA